MRKIISLVLGVFAASCFATSVQAATRTLILSGEILCSSNGVDPPPFLCSPDLAVVDPSIGPGSTFEVTVTLPTVNPSPGLPGLFFPNQTVYPVPRDGEIDMSMVVDESFSFSVEELVRPQGFTPPPELQPGNLRVDVANDEFFGFPTPTDLWNVFGVGSSAAISADNQFCDVFFGSPGGQGPGGEELGNLDSQEYFVPDSRQGPVTPWNVSVRCQTFDPTQEPPFQVILFGNVDSLTCASGCLTAQAGPDQSTECTSHAGELVLLDGSGSDAPADALYTWTEPTTGQELSGVIADMQLPLGSFEVTLTVSAEDLSDSDTLQIHVSDTQPPEVSAALEPGGFFGRRYDIVATATDACDPAPVVSAMVGAQVSDGQHVTIIRPGQNGLVILRTDELELGVEAVDASGNRATAMASP